jgi:hypothetical protein
MQHLFKSLIGTCKSHNESGASMTRHWQPGCALESEAEFFNFAPGKLVLVNKIVSLGSREVQATQHALLAAEPSDMTVCLGDQNLHWKNSRTFFHRVVFQY